MTLNGLGEKPGNRMKETTGKSDAQRVESVTGDRRPMDRAGHVARNPQSPFGVALTEF